MQRKTVWLTLVTLMGVLTIACEEPPGEEPKAELIDQRKIWDKARHNAFTDLVRFNDHWYCVFREAEHHASSDGALRVITSADGEQWSSASLVPPEPGHDLRDPHLSITPDNRLMLVGGDFDPEGTEPRGFRTLAWFSSDGQKWSEPTPVSDSWLWRVTWHEGVAYGVGYTWKDEALARLYKSSDGTHFEVLVERLFDKGNPSESSIVFLDDGTAYCLLRRDEEQDTSAQLGISRPPYTDWTWKDLGRRLGGAPICFVYRMVAGWPPAGSIRTKGRFEPGDGGLPSCGWIRSLAQ